MLTLTNRSVGEKYRGASIRSEVLRIGKLFSERIPDLPEKYKLEYEAFRTMGSELRTHIAVSGYIALSI